ncbi:unnamed protein product [Larinioides sclopetarius]|uniref:SCP domain-containing protein n=1 Tax=Larinioides sclopetarius TaxID=280406 RepID=A0AAV1YTH9_9ARAC
MSHQLTALVVLFTITMAKSYEECVYKKFDQNHAGCQPRNTSCNILNNEVTNEDKILIVKLYNQYREKVALGNETIPDSTLKAANMREMEWDDELAYLAQKHVETCQSKYDCHACKQIDRYDHVGQMIYVSSTTDFPSEWEKMLNPYNLIPHHKFQLLSAETWRVGCGKVVFEDSGIVKTMIICNYGPGADVKGCTMEGCSTLPFKTGSSCTECPSGTCCGDSCQSFGIHSNFTGLCKWIPVSTLATNEGSGMNGRVD